MRSSRKKQSDNVLEEIKEGLSERDRTVSFDVSESDTGSKHAQCAVAESGAVVVADRCTARPRKVRRPIQEQWIRKRVWPDWSWCDEGATDTYDFVPRLSDHHPAAFDKQFMLRHKRDKGRVGDILASYVEHCYAIDGDANSDYGNGFLDDAPTAEVVERLSAWDYRSSWQGLAGLEDRIPECFRYLPRVIGCLSTPYPDQEWLRNKIKALIPRGWDMKSASSSSDRKHPVLITPDGTVYEVHPILAKMRRIGLDERRLPLFTPLTMSHPGYPPSPRGAWMAPWTPKQDRREVASVRLFTSAGAVIVDGRISDNRPTVELKSTLTALANKVVYGFDMRRTCARCPETCPDRVVVMKAVFPMEVLRQVSLIHANVRAYADGGMELDPKVLLEWRIDGIEASHRKFTAMTLLHARGGYDLKHTICKEFSFFDDYDSELCASACGKSVQVEIVLEGWGGRSFSYPTFRFLTASGLSHPTLRTLHIARTLGADFLHPDSWARRCLRGKEFAVMRKALTSLGRLPHDVQSYIVSFIFPSLDDVLRPYKKDKRRLFLSSNPASPSRTNDNEGSEGTPTYLTDSPDPALLHIVYLKHRETPFFRFVDTSYRTGRTKYSYFRVRTHHLPRASTGSAPATMATWLKDTWDVFPETDARPFETAEACVSVDDSVHVCAVDIEIGFVAYSFFVTDDQFSPVSVNLPLDVFKRLRSWSAEVCWRDARGGNTARVWLEDCNGHMLVPSLTLSAASAVGSYSVVGGNIGENPDPEAAIVRLMMSGDSATSSLCIRRLKLRLYTGEGAARPGLSLVKHAQQKRRLGGIPEKN